MVRRPIVLCLTGSIEKQTITGGLSKQSASPGKIRRFLGRFPVGVLITLCQHLRKSARRLPKIPLPKKRALCWFKNRNHKKAF